MKFFIIFSSVLLFVVFAGALYVATSNPKIQIERKSVELDVSSALTAVH